MFSFKHFKGILPIHGIGNNNINKIKKIISNNTFDYKKMNENIINQLNVYIVEFVI